MHPTISGAATLPDTTARDDESPSATPPLLTASLLAGSTANHPVSGVALVLRSHLRTDRHQRPYAALTLRLADTTVTEARWWQFPLPPDRCPSEGTLYRFTGWTDTFNGSSQLRLTDAQPAPDADLGPFTPSVRRPLADLLAEYDARLTQLTQLDEPLAALLRQALSGETFARFCTWPAAQLKHGAVRHGLLAHSLRVTALAESLAASYVPADLPHDRALVIAAALLHDLGKTQTLPPIAGSAPPAAASQLDHVTLGALMVHSAADRLNPPLAPERLHSLLHVILAHHGRADWGATVTPQTVESWLVHLADYAESRLWSFTADAPSSAALSLVDQP